MEAMLQPVMETAVMPRQADNDAQVLELWLHDKAKKTQRDYGTDVKQFFEFVGVPLVGVTLRHLQAFADHLLTQEPATQSRKLYALKSLLSFAQQMGYLRFNVGAALKTPKIKNKLAERILSEGDIHRIIAHETNTRNHVLLTLLYASGGRVSEICGLKWRDVQERQEGGQVTLFGKGGKTRVVLIGPDPWKALCSLRKNNRPDMPVFKSRKGLHLDPSQVWRIVHAAAKRAGVDGNVSPHWFRHAHASHSLDRGCPAQLLQATLGHASLATTSRYTHARPNSSSSLYLAI